MYVALLGASIACLVIRQFALQIRLSCRVPESSAHMQTGKETKTGAPVEQFGEGAQAQSAAGQKGNECGTC